MLWEPVVYMKKGSPDYSSYPIGSVILSAAEDVGQDWLKCDGSFINAEQYPELVAHLGRNLPGLQDAKKAGEGEEYSGTFSTSCLYDGFIWTYWFERQKLLGWLCTGEYVTEIDIGTEDGEALPFLQSVDAPVVLSICEGRVFLCQTLADFSEVYIYTGQFASTISLVTLTKLDVGSEIAKLENHGLESDMTGGAFSIVEEGSGLLTYLRYIPQVVFVKNFSIDGTARDCYIVLIGAYRTTYRSASYGELSYIWDYYALAMPAEDVTSPLWARLFSQGRSSDSGASSAVNTLLGFSRKMSGEFLALRKEPVSGSTNYYSMRSQVFGIYDSNGVKTQDVTAGDPSLVQPIASEEFYIYRAYIKSGEMYIRAGRVTPFTGWGKATYPDNDQKIQGLTLPSSAQLFPDSLEYITSHNMFIIFVGSGILFSRTPLDMNSWGYLDTSSFFGVISQWGNAEFDVAANTLCLSGRDTYGTYCAGLLKLHGRFDYATDGAWLPYIVSSGIPAWIKSGSSNRYERVETVGGNSGPVGGLEGTTGQGGVTGGGTGGDTGGSGNKPGELPSGYTQLEYVTMASTTKLNLSVAARTNTLRVVLTAQLTDPAAKTYARYWLTEQSTNNSDATANFHVMRTTSTGSSAPDNAVDVYTKQGSIHDFATASFADFTTTEKFTLDYNGPDEKCTLAGETVDMTINQVGLTSLYLGLAPEYSTSYAEKLRVYSIQVYVGGVLKRDFVPCINSAGIPGLYDKTGKYFAMAATQSDLTQGPAVQPD